MLQYCGKQSKIPYYIKAIDKNVYSLEELNYFIYNHMNLVYRSFFREELFAYLEKELGRADMAAALRKMAGEDATIQDFAVYFLKESGYYSSDDLKNISDLILNIDLMSRPERLTLEADALFRSGKYESALRIYFDILNDMKKDGLGDAFYARIAFAIGVIYARLFFSRTANAYFSYAYDLYPNPTYAKACVYMSIINHDDEELLRTIIRYKVSDEALAAIRARIESLRREIENSPQTEDFAARSYSRRECENIIENWKDQYYNMLS